MHRALALVAPCLLAPGLLASACGSPAPAAVAPAPLSPRPEPSALAGLVCALEALAAVRPEGCAVEVRAVEADVLHDAGAGRLSERVFLDLSVFAPSPELARAGYDQLWVALAGGTGAASPAEPASEARVLAALGQLARPAGLDERWVSWSERLRIEVAPGAPAPAPTQGAPAFDGLERYVRTCASRVDSVGQVNLRRLGARHGTPQVLVRPGQEYQRFYPAQIGAFLAGLENDSPAVRVARLVIQRSAHEPDVTSARGWTFEAELSLQERARS